MPKSLYSLMLSDEVVEQIDRLALKSGTNRSQLVNRILAEHCSLLTPERRIEAIFRRVNDLFESSDELISRLAPHQTTMQVRTALAYRYRPTLRYELRLYKEAEEGSIGELSMTLRTQAAELLSLMENFLTAWVPLEKRVLERKGIAPRYELQPGRFVRTVETQPLPGESGEEAAGRIGDALSLYVRLLDGAFKAFVAGEENETAMQARLAGWAGADCLL